MERFFKVGDSAVLTHTITQEDVNQFVQLTGDKNPLHVDLNFAQGTNFRKPVVHGMLTASYISTLIGMQLPGKGALWTSQTLEFLAPAFIGDVITVRGKVTQTSESTQMLVLSIEVTNQNSQVLVKGTSHVRLLGDQVPKVSNSAKVEAPRANSNTSKEQNFSQRALVVGGSRGIGAATVRKLVAAGFEVAFTYHRSSEEAKSLENETGAKAFSIDWKPTGPGVFHPEA